MEVPKHESEDYTGLHGVQTEKLRHHEKQEERSRPDRALQVLQVLQKAHRTQRNEIMFEVGV